MMFFEFLFDLTVAFVFGTSLVAWIVDFFLTAGADLRDLFARRDDDDDEGARRD